MNLKNIIAVSMDLGRLDSLLQVRLDNPGWQDRPGSDEYIIEWLAHCMHRWDLLEIAYNDK